MSEHGISLDTIDAIGLIEANKRNESFNFIANMKESSSVTETAHRLWREHIRPGDLVCDATAGNGHDALFLAEQVGPAGRVWAIDCQEAAIASTRQRLLASDPALLDRIELIHGCHSQWPKALTPGTVQLCVYNLGYLPHGDHTCTTQTDTTLKSLRGMETLLAPGGLISCTCYVGHPGGAEEARCVEQWATSLSPREWCTQKISWLNRSSCPFLILAYKATHREPARHVPPGNPGPDAPHS